MKARRPRRTAWITWGSNANRGAAIPALRLKPRANARATAPVVSESFSGSWAMLSVKQIKSEWVKDAKIAPRLKMLKTNAGKFVKRDASGRYLKCTLFRTPLCL